MTFKRILRYLMTAAIVGLLLCAAALLGCNALVVHNARGRTFDCCADVPTTEVALLLGTAPTSRLTNRPNAFFISRITAAAELYKAGKVRTILISGDAHSHRGADETRAMAQALIEQGVPASAILRDGKGYRTEASIGNAYYDFGLRSFTIVSQRFHNERALFIADHLGPDFGQVQAYNAESPTHILSYITYAREALARIKMFIDLARYRFTNAAGNHDGA